MVLYTRYICACSHPDRLVGLVCAAQQGRSSGWYDRTAQAGGRLRGAGRGLAARGQGRRGAAGGDGGWRRWGQTNTLVRWMASYLFLILYTTILWEYLGCLSTVVLPTPPAPTAHIACRPCAGEPHLSIPNDARYFHYIPKVIMEHTFPGVRPCQIRLSLPQSV